MNVQQMEARGVVLMKSSNVARGLIFTLWYGNTFCCSTKAGNRMRLARSGDLARNRKTSNA